MSKLHIKNFLGQGEFGIVRKAIYTKDDSGSFEVAIKMLRGNTFFRIYNDRY